MRFLVKKKKKKVVCEKKRSFAEDFKFMKLKWTQFTFE